MRLLERIGIPKTPGVGPILAALLIDAIGTGLFISFSLLYFTEVVGLPLGQVGVAISVATFIGLAANPLGGVLVDRFGPRTVLIVAFLMQAVGFAGYLLVASIPVLLLVAILATGGLRVFWVAFPTLVAELSEGGDRDRWYAITGAARESGIGAGGLIAGAMVGLGGEGAYRVLLLGNTVTFLLAAGLMLLVPARARIVPPPDEAKPSFREVFRDRPYLAMMSANTIYAYCAWMASVALPIFVVDKLDGPVWLVGVLFSIYTGVLAIGMPLTVGHLRRFRRTRTLVSSALIYITGFALYLGALWVPSGWLAPYLIGATVVFSFGDVLHGPTSSALAASAGPERLRGRYIALYSLSWGVGGAIAPAMVAGGFLLGPGGPWATTALLAVAAIVMVLRIEPHLPRVAVVVSSESVAAEA